MDSATLWFLGWIAAIAIGGVVGYWRGSVGHGLLWSFFLGPVGWLVTILWVRK
jgi:hypothetical protein